MTGTFHLELHDMMRAMCDALNMNNKRLKRVSGLVEQIDTMETRLPHPTTSSTCDYIHAFSSYDGIYAENILRGKLRKIVFLQNILCVNGKNIKKATSVLTHSSLSWWESLTPSDKLQTWANMKMLMRE
jgi:hypothetical protein